LYFFKTAKGHNSITSRSSGSVQVNIARREVIEDIPLFIPCIEKQKRIVSILKSLDDKIEVNRKINENLEQQAQALFKSWFVDFEPFKDGEFVESELGMIPKGWRVKEAQDVFDINIGKTPPRKESEWFTESKEDNVWVSIADMGSCGVFISDSSEYLTDEAIKRFNVLTVEKDSVLLSFKLTVGRVAIADTRLTTNEAIARFILPDKCYREFLYLYLKQYKYENLGSTSSIATAVNSKTIKGMKLIMPPTDFIKSFSNNTRPLFEQIRNLQQESRRLATLRDTLLPKLMSGELKVNEIKA
jgi:type I restriction enzyme S subunit